MKLIIQIPCYNEEETLPITFKDLPKRIDKIDSIEYLVINDGSTDQTKKVAKELGIHHIVSFPQNRGLARAFTAGMDAAVRLGADIIVNTDADNQYNGHDIKKLVGPILDNKADIVIGDRQVEGIAHFSFIKKKLQKFGSKTVSKLANVDVPDTTSGFRAFSREAALCLNVITNFTYTLETIIQAGKKKLSVTSVPIKTNEKTRESRLFKSIPSYIFKSVQTMMKVDIMYAPIKFFSIFGIILFTSGLILSIRFLYYFLIGQGTGHVQSVILAGTLLLSGYLTTLIGIIAHLLSINRILIENSLYRLKRLEINQSTNKK